MRLGKEKVRLLKHLEKIKAGTVAVHNGRSLKDGDWEWVRVYCGNTLLVSLSSKQGFEFWNVVDRNFPISLDNELDNPFYPTREELDLLYLKCPKSKHHLLEFYNMLDLAAKDLCIVLEDLK